MGASVIYQYQAGGAEQVNMITIRSDTMDVDLNQYRTSSRMIGDTVFSFYGSGEYSSAGERFSYGYDRRVWVTRRPTGVEVRDVIPFKGPRLFQAPSGGGGGRYEADGGRYVFEVLGDTLVYSEDGSWLRRWIRARPAGSTP